MFVYDGTSSVLIRAIWSSILRASRGKTRVLLCLSMTERPVLLSEQFGQAFLSASRGKTRVLLCLSIMERLVLLSE